MESSKRSILQKVEARVLSQNGEDGILQYIYTKIGVTNRRFVDLGCNKIRRSNTGNLLINHGWSGLWIDAEKNTGKVGKLNIPLAPNRKIQVELRLRDDIATLESKREKIRCIQSFITVENVEQILLENGISDIDLLSIDLDGNDYWIWKAIQNVSPRVVVIEYNASIDPEWSVTVKYDPNFDRHKRESLMHYGASLSALTKLAKSKGYCLVGCDCSGVNAFFVRNDVAKDKIDSMSVSEAYYPSRRRPNYFELTRSLDFEEV